MNYTSRKTEIKGKMDMVKKARYKCIWLL